MFKRQLTVGALALLLGMLFTSVGRPPAEAGVLCSVTLNYVGWVLSDACGNPYFVCKRVHAQVYVNSSPTYTTAWANSQWSNGHANYWWDINGGGWTGSDYADYPMGTPSASMTFNVENDLGQSCSTNGSVSMTD